MLYRIRAKIIEEKSAEFLEKLMDGSIEWMAPLSSKDLMVRRLWPR